MPLSKERMRERKKLDRLSVKPMSNLAQVYVKPETDTLRLKSSGIKSLINTTAPPVIPDVMLYDPVYVPQINPVVKPYEPIPNCPDGRWRSFSKADQIGK